jgi:hypothetical protein
MVEDSADVWEEAVMDNLKNLYNEIWILTALHIKIMVLGHNSMSFDKQVPPFQKGRGRMFLLNSNTYLANYMISCCIRMSTSLHKIHLGWA